MIGLIDASVSIKVAVNHGKHKNRLGAYHASQKVLLDFSFLKTLPEDQVRNGMAELIKISVVGNTEIFELLEAHGVDLLQTRFGYLDGTPELRSAGERLTHQAIATMLELEAPNLHEINLDRVIAFGHTWSPTLELTPPTRSSTATPSTSTWRCRRHWPSSAAICRSTSATGCSD